MAAPIVTHILRRGRFTDNLLAYVSQHLQAPVILGDNEQPADGGWSQEQPGKGIYVPWVSITAGPGRPNLTETLAKRLAASWRLVYLTKSAGGNRQQADYAADQARVLMSALHHQVFSDGFQNWKVLKSEITQMGQIVRVDATDPPTFELTDAFEVWVEPSP